jgi:hypothetical protein
LVFSRIVISASLDQQSLLRSVSSPSFATGGWLFGEGCADERKSLGV